MYCTSHRSAVEAKAKQDHPGFTCRLETDAPAALRRLARRLRPNRVYDVASIADFLAAWSAILGIAFAATWIDSPWAYIAAGLLIAGRFRALEELAHFAMHNALFRHYRFGLGVADMLSQFPLFNPATRVWSVMHCSQHHPQVARIGLDPALQSLLDAGFAKRMRKVDFVLLVLHPFSPSGLATRVRFAAMGLTLINVRCVR